MGELNLEEILNESERVETKFKQIPKFPPVMRDISLVVSKDTPVAEVERIIRDSSKFLEKIELFDVYEGKGIPEGKKSVAFSLTFRAPDKTLSDEEVNKIVDGIIKSLSEKGIQLRG